MEKSEKIELIRKWLESGASDFDHEKSKILITKIYDMSDTQLDAIFKMYQESLGQKVKSKEAEDEYKNKFLLFISALPGSAKFGIFLIASIISFFTYSGLMENKLKDDYKATMIEMTCEANVFDEIIELSKDPFSRDNFERIMELEMETERIVKENGFDNVEDFTDATNKFKEDTEFMKEITEEAKDECGFSFKRFGMEMMFGG